MPRRRTQGRERYPSGKLKPISAAEFATPTTVRRMLDQALKAASNPLLGSELGRLRLTGVLTDREMSAGLRYAEIVGRYHRIKGVPQPSVRSVAYEQGTARGRSLINDPDPETVVTISRNFDSARAVLARFGRSMISIVDSITVFEAPIVAGAYGALRCGLSALAAHFGLTTKSA